MTQINDNLSGIMTNINLRHPRNPRLKFIHDTPSFLLDIVPYLINAITSTSTRTSLGRVFAATHERAGLLVNDSP